MRCKVVLLNLAIFIVPQKHIYYEFPKKTFFDFELYVEYLVY